MKRILFAAAVTLAGVGLLSGCAGSEGIGIPGKADQVAASPKPVNLYEASDANDDPNYITHWIFKQKLDDGSTVTCVAARSPSSSSLAISCLPNTIVPAVTK